MKPTARLHELGQGASGWTTSLGKCSDSGQLGRCIEQGRALGSGV